MPSFGENLKRVRNERGMTQEEMAALLHTSKQVISRYENGHRTPRVDVVARYAEGLQIGIGALLPSKAPQRPNTSERRNGMTLNDLISLVRADEYRVSYRVTPRLTASMTMSKFDDASMCDLISMYGDAIVKSASVDCDVLEIQLSKPESHDA